MKKALITLLIIFLLSSLGNSYETYKQVKVFVPDQASFQKLLQSGIDLEGAEGKIGDWFEIVLEERELALLQDLGFLTLTIIDDYSKFIESRLFKGPYDALGFGYGSMGGYYTYNEVIQQLDSMRLLYPNLISAKQIIGTSIENRFIYAVKISDNPETDETHEPSVLYTALTHAREPQSMMTLLYYMWWLLENYNTNSEANYLVNNRQIWFIPVVNPDGYVYNQSTNPNGGGLWRKNRRNNGDGSFGVDLNRNFGPFAYWNAPNGGSSTTPSDNTYRGTAPFSEPETQTLRNFLTGKNIRACFNYHTYGNLLIYPYGALVRETPDSLVYREYAKDMTMYNGYKYGTDQQTVGYATRGNSDDYMYDGDIPNNGKIFAMTPEVGSSSDGFWPPTSRILPLALENLYPNLYLSKVVGAFPRISIASISDSSNDGFLERNEKFTLQVTLRNKGLDSAQNFYLQLNSNNTDLILPSEAFYVSTLAPLSNQVLNFDCRVKGRATTGVNSNIVFKIADQSGYISYDTLNVIIGKLLLTFSDSADNGTMNWSTGVSWGLSTDAQSPLYSFTDSPSGNYSNNTDNSLTLLNSLKLSSASIIKLQFSAKWNIESRYDFLLVEASSNGGTTWRSVKGKYSKPGSGSGVQTLGTFGYDGVQSTWINEEIDLSSFASSQFKIRFRLRSDSYITADGFYLDNLRIIYGKVDSAKFSDMAYSPQFIDFGNVKLYESSDTNIVIENLFTSNESLRCSLNLKYGIDYRIDTTRNFSVPIGGNQVVSISFQPQSVGLLTDTLIIYHSSDVLPNPVLIPLSGHGVNIISYKFLAKIYLNSETNQDTLIFGAEEGATSGIDSTFNEIELGEIPPAGSFDARWVLDGNIGTKIDVRDTIWNGNPRNIYKLTFQLATDNDTLIIRWKKKELADGSYILKDSSTNGELVSINMKNQESLMVTGTQASTLIIIHEINPIITVKVNRGWNLVSVPSIFENKSKNYIFPGSASKAFEYNGVEYLISDSLFPGKGYWLKFNYPREYYFFRSPTLVDTFNVRPGWNMIGTIGKLISVDDIESYPSDNVISFIYGYRDGYKIIDTLVPGSGYWVKARDTGKIILNSVKQNQYLSSKKVSLETEFYYLNFQNRNVTQKLFFTNDEIENHNMYQLPPLPPSEVFDVRFATQRSLEVFDVMRNYIHEIKIQTNNFPVKISWDIINSGNTFWSLEIYNENGLVNTFDLSKRGATELSDINEKVYLIARNVKNVSDILPANYSLEQNYPNPFNSKTKIKYSVPKGSKVTIKLYDLLGRELGVLVNDFHSAGYYEHNFDAGSLPSGVYYYQMSSDNFVQVRKLLLLK